MRRAYIYQDIASKIGSALALPSLHKGVCATKTPTEYFGICAGYASDYILAGLLTTTLNDLRLIRELAAHIYQDFGKKTRFTLIPTNLCKRKCARKAPAEDFGICARYAPDSFLEGFLMTALNELTIQ